MKRYLGIKTVQAFEVIRYNGNIYTAYGINLVRRNNKELSQKIIKDGKHSYFIKYPDGYESECPKEEFEKYYIDIDDGVDEKRVEMALNKVLNLQGK